jgi:hypothetical protein
MRKVLAVVFSSAMFLVPATAYANHGRHNGNKNRQSQTQSQTQTQSQRQCILVIAILEPASC